MMAVIESGCHLKNGCTLAGGNAAYTAMGEAVPKDKTEKIRYDDESIISSQRKQLEIYRTALAPFADLIPAAMHGLPEGTKFAPKLTLAPFVAAHKALYGEELESP